MEQPHSRKVRIKGRNPLSCFSVSYSLQPADLYVIVGWPGRIFFKFKVVQYGFTKNAGFSVFSYDIQFIDTGGHP